MYKYKLAVSAIALASALSSPAYAACGVGQYEYVDSSTNPATVSCVNIFNIGHHGGPAVTGDVTDHSGHGSRINAEVHGTNGVALGSGAIVGAWTPGTSPKCTIGQGQNQSDWDGQQGTCNGTYTPGTMGVATPVAGGTAVGAHSSVQADQGTALGNNASVASGATHSTAIGADAVATKPNTVVLGTANDTVVAPGGIQVPSLLADDGKGNKTAIVPGYVGATDGAHITILGGGGVATTGDFVAAGAKGTTTINGDGATFDFGADGKVTIQDPTLTITGGGHTTTIHNGTITNDGGTNTTGGTMTDTLHVTSTSQFDSTVVVGTTAGDKTFITGASISTGQVMTTNGSDSAWLNASGAVATDGTKSAALTAGGVGASNGSKATTLTADGVSSVNGSGDVTKINAGKVVTSNGSNATQVDSSGVYTTGYMSASSGLYLDTFGSGVPEVGATLENYGNRLSSLEGWRSVATNQINDLYNRSNKANEGVAIALAAQNFTLETGKRFGLSGNFGTFEGQNALAASAALRLSHDWQVNAGVGFGTNQGTVGARVGVVGQW